MQEKQQHWLVVTSGILAFAWILGSFLFWITGLHIAAGFSLCLIFLLALGAYIGLKK